MGELKIQEKNGNHMSLNDTEFNEERLKFIEANVGINGKSIVDHLQFSPKDSKTIALEISKLISGSR